MLRSAASARPLAGRSNASAIAPRASWPTIWRAKPNIWTFVALDYEMVTVVRMKLPGARPPFVRWGSAIGASRSHVRLVDQKDGPTWMPALGSLNADPFATPVGGRTRAGQHLSKRGRRQNQGTTPLLQNSGAAAAEGKWNLRHSRTCAIGSVARDPATPWRGAPGLSTGGRSA